MIVMSFVYVKNEEDIEETEEKYMQMVRYKNGYVRPRYTKIHLSPSKYKEFYTELGVRIIDDINKHGYDVEMMEERFPPPQAIDTLAITSHEYSLILISKKGWGDLRKDYMSDRRKDPSIEKWSEVKEYFILDVLIHEFAHIIMNERKLENRDKVEKYSNKIVRENEKENPDKRLVEHLDSKIKKIEHGRKFNRIYKTLRRKYKPRNLIDTIIYHLSIYK